MNTPEISPEKKRIVFGLLFSGFFLILCALFYSLYFKPNPQSQMTLATAERELGKSFVFKAGFSKREPIADSIAIAPLDSIETLETGEVKLSFLNGSILRIFSNSLVTVELNSDTSETLVTIARGQIKIEALGRDHRLFVSAEGKKYSAEDFARRSDLQESVKANESSEIPLPTGEGEITEEEINTHLSRQKASFYKCYTQLLQGQPDAKGAATLNFTIDGSGHIVDPQIQSSQLNQADFHRCLIEVLKRIEFRSFDGAPVTAVFPIRFE